MVHLVLGERDPSSNMASSPPGRGRAQDVGPSSASVSSNRRKPSFLSSFKRKPSPKDEERERRSWEAAQHASDVIMPPPPRTNMMVWCCVIGCSVFAIVVILAGLVVLIGYLAFHPQIPKFNVRNASLNTLLLDKDFLLSSDSTIVIEAHNPNTKVSLSYHYIKFDLKFEKHTIATQFVEPFMQLPKNSTGFILDMDAVAVQMEAREGEGISLSLQRNSPLRLDLEGTIKAKSHFGGITSVKYWMYSLCHLAFSPPPVGNGTLLSRDCRSRR